MTPEFALAELQKAKARAQGPDEGERAIGGALAAYWSEVLRQYSLAISHSGPQNAPESILGRSGAILASPEVQRFNRAVERAEEMLHEEIDTAEPPRLIRLLRFPRWQRPLEWIQASDELESAWVELMRTNQPR